MRDGAARFDNSSDNVNISNIVRDVPYIAEMPYGMRLKGSCSIHIGTRQVFGITIPEDDVKGALHEYVEYAGERHEIMPKERILLIRPRYEGYWTYERS